MFVKNLLSVLFPALASLLVSFAFNETARLASPNGYYSVVYFAVMCFLFNILYALNSKTKSFSDLLFAGIIIRLLMALIVILVYAIKLKSDFSHFAIHFVCHYILFTIFEIRYLLQLIRNNSHQQP